MGKYFKKGNIIGLDNGSDLLLKEKSYFKEWIDLPNIKIKICDAYSKKISESIKFLTSSLKMVRTISNLK